MPQWAALICPPVAMFRTFPAIGQRMAARNDSTKSSLRRGATDFPRSRFSSSGVRLPPTMRNGLLRKTHEIRVRGSALHWPSPAALRLSRNRPRGARAMARDGLPRRLGALSQLANVVPNRPSHRCGQYRSMARLSGGGVGEAIRVVQARCEPRLCLGARNLAWWSEAGAHRGHGTRLGERQHYTQEGTRRREAPEVLRLGIRSARRYG